MSAYEGSLMQDMAERSASPRIFPSASPKVCTFGTALTLLKSGSRVARIGWNGRDMFIVLQKGYPDGIPINANTAEATGIPQGTVCKFLPYLMMRTVDGSFVPWLASQTDILAEDWVIL